MLSTGRVSNCCSKPIHMISMPSATYSSTISVVFFSTDCWLSKKSKFTRRRKRMQSCGLLLARKFSSRRSLTTLRRVGTPRPGCNCPIWSSNFLPKSLSIVQILSFLRSWVRNSEKLSISALISYARRRVLNSKSRIQKDIILSLRNCWPTLCKCM